MRKALGIGRESLGQLPPQSPQICGTNLGEWSSSQNGINVEPDEALLAEIRRATFLELLIKIGLGKVCDRDEFPSGCRRAGSSRRR
jgi:hypothetical protein